MNTISSVTSAGAGVSRFQPVAQPSKLKDQQAANDTSSMRAAAELLRRVLATTDANGHDLDVVA